MKKSLGLLSLLGILILSGCGGSGNIVEYNDKFVAIVKECTDANQTLYQTFNTEGVMVDSISESVQTNIDICENARQQAEKLGDYEKDSSLKNAVVDLLSYEVDYLKKFSSTKNYWNTDNLTDEDRAAYNGMVSDLNDSQTKLNQQFVYLQDVQEAFATKHGLNLE